MLKLLSRLLVTILSLTSFKRPAMELNISNDRYILHPLKLLKRVK